jgi:hypothetical protein
MPDNESERPTAEVDRSPSAVHARLTAFIAEHREAQARGDPHALRESDQLLAAWAENALQAQAEAERRLAELEAYAWRMRGGWMQ